MRSSARLLTDTVVKKYENFRSRLGILNFVGETSKVLFGTLDENDAGYYDEEIRNFERNSEDTTDLLKQQAYVIKRQKVPRRLGRPLKRPLDEAETGLSWPNS